MHHRCFDFDVTASIKEFPQFPDNPGARFEHLARLLVGDQVEITLPVAQLDVRQPMPFLGQRQQRFRKKENLLDPDGQFIGLGSKQTPRTPMESPRSSRWYN